MSVESGTPDELNARASWESLVERNIPLVKYVLGKISGRLPRCVDRDDLLAAGSLGLVEAAQRFDASRNVPFHSYAIPRIWGSMLDELRRHDWLSTDMREQVTSVQKAVARRQQGGDMSPSAEDLAEELDMPTKRVRKLMALAALERKRADAENGLLESAAAGLYGRVGTAMPRGPYEETEFQDTKRSLADAIAALPARDREVILLRYHEELYLHEIGQVLNVSESRVCQIHSQALRRLRKSLKRVGLEVGA